MTLTIVSIESASEMMALISKHPQVQLERGKHGLDFLHIRTSLANATISLQGAQVLHFQMHGEAPLLWQGVPESFAAGKAMRAGIPICWPWFSSHPKSGYPAHGFARNLCWDLQNIETLADARMVLGFLLKPDHPHWPLGCSLEFTVTLGASLEIALCTTNHGNEPQTISQAFHTYFNVGDVRQTAIRGLSSYPFFDYGSPKPAAKLEPLLKDFEAIERIYQDPKGFCEIIDPVLRRSIVVTSSGCQSTVVWNPGSERAMALGDLGPDGYLKMLCVESANAPIAHDAITIEPGTQHTLCAQYRVIAHD
jgi:glucose-6-phosphate 1-epimerase